MKSYDDLLKSTQPDEGYSSFWGVVYYEGVRNNHILFSDSDVRRFSKTATPSAGVPWANESDSISDVMVSLFRSSDLSSVRQLITNLNFKQRFQVFTLYRRYLDRWSAQLRGSLH